MKENVYFFFGSIITQPSPDPSKVLDPSKKSVQKLSTTTVHESTSTSKAKSTILQSISSACENRRRSSWVSDVSLSSSAR